MAKRKTSKTELKPNQRTRAKAKVGSASAKQDKTECPAGHSCC
ncbi:MAG: hypothetical protein ABIA04_03065 [Pseudomonadota bacterium]